MNKHKEVMKISRFVEDHLRDKSICYISLFELKRIFEVSAYQNFKDLLYDICQDDLKYSIHLEDKVVGFFSKHRHSVTAIVSDTAYRLRVSDANDLAFIVSTDKSCDDAPYIETWAKDDHIFAIDSKEVMHCIIEKDDLSVGYIVLGAPNIENDSVELMRIVTSLHGQGFGESGIHLLKKYVFDTLKLHRLWFDLHINHKRVKSLFESIGFYEEGVLRDVLKLENEYYSVYRMSILSTD